MPKRLQDNLSSAYFEAANKLSTKNGRRRIVAYVESYDDIFFWRNVLSGYETETLYFEVMLPSKQKLSRGKKSAIMAAIGKKVGKDMIACVDSDYDYLLQNTTEMSRDILNNPYVLHTYTYAIENYQCYAPSLHDVCVMVTLNDRRIFDFEQFFSEYSKIIFPLFVWNIWYYRKGGFNEFTISDFNTVITTGHFTHADSNRILDRLRHKVSVKIRQLISKNPNAKSSYLALKSELKSLGVAPEITYLFIQGHHLCDTLVLPLLTRICETLHREREKEITKSAIHQTQRNNELKAYNHSTADVGIMLRRNTAFKDSLPFKMLHNDIMKLIEDKKENHQQQAVDAMSVPHIQSKSI